MQLLRISLQAKRKRHGIAFGGVVLFWTGIRRLTSVALAWSSSVTTTHLYQSKQARKQTKFGHRLLYRPESVPKIAWSTYTGRRSPIRLLVSERLLVCVSMLFTQQSARLTTAASILGQIVESLYSVKQAVPSRHQEASRIEEALEALYLDLPSYLKIDLSSGIPRNLPPPHVVVLNMQYWNAILLLHRPL